MSDTQKGKATLGAEGFHYRHRVAYYETDAMGIAHHSNYVRWMEEARVRYLDAIGCGFRELEDAGVQSPVLAVEARYKTPVAFDDEVDIAVRPLEVGGARIKIGYTMTNAATGALACEGATEHCLGRGGRPLRLARDLPQLHDALSERLSS